MTASENLPTEYLDRFAGLEFVYDGVWSMRSISLETALLENGGRLFVGVVEHSRAQMYFAIDDALSLYVEDGGWIKLFNHLSDLEELSRFVEANATGTSGRENLGYYKTIDEFEAGNRELLSDALSFSPVGDTCNKVYIVEGVPIYLGRFYSRDFMLIALKGG